MIERRPRAPVLRSMARWAIEVSASSVKLSSTFLQLEQLAILLHQRVPGLAEDLHQRLDVEILERRVDRQAADELWDETEFEQILRSVALSNWPVRRSSGAATWAPKPMDLPSRRSPMIFSRPAKAPPQMNRMLVVSTCRNSCCGCLRPPCGGTEAVVPSMSLRQRLLHALARHVAGDGGVLGLAADLVDLVDIDDAALRLLDIIVAGLQQLQDDVLDILADIAGFRQRRRVGHGEGHVEGPGRASARAASCRSRSARFSRIFDLASSTSPAFEPCSSLL